MRIPFPDPHQSDENGIVVVGGEITVENVLNAYSLGIFPWPHQNLPMLWFCPLERGILDFKNFKIPRSAVKFLKKKNYRMTVDESFSEVIDACAKQKRAGQPGTWITPAIKKVYTKLFELGHAHSIECWNENDELVGGLYGLYIQNVFSGESMFFKESGASKACLIMLVEHLKNMGHTWFDTQMVTGVVELFGGEYIPRDEYLKKLKKSQSQTNPWRKFSK